MDSDDELPYIKFSHSNMYSEQKNSEDATTNATEASNGICYRSNTVADLTVCTSGVVVVDSDSSDSNSLKERAFKYSRDLREKHTMSSVFSSADNSYPDAESCDLQLDVDAARTSVTDHQSYCSADTDNSPAASKSYEDSDEFSSEQLCQTAVGDTNSQASSVQSGDNRRRKRPQKADDPEAVVHVLLLMSFIFICLVRCKWFMPYSDHSFNYIDQWSV